MLCFLCHLPIHRHSENNSGICQQCVKNIPILQSPCKCCGLPAFSQDKNENSLCYRCRENPPHWHQLIAVSGYESPLKQLVHKFKFSSHIQLATMLARLMLLAWHEKQQQFNLIKPDIVTCIPLHHSRYWSRGYNQSELLAKPIAKALQCQYLPYLLTRNNQGVAQKILSKKQRQQNIANVFSCEKDLSGKTIAIIDDIVTTGATVNKASELLIKQGAQHIQIICLCRTIL